MTTIVALKGWIVRHPTEAVVEPSTTTGWRLEHKGAREHLQEKNEPRRATRAGSVARVTSMMTIWHTGGVRRT